MIKESEAAGSCVYTNLKQRCQRQLVALGLIVSGTSYVVSQAYDQHLNMILGEVEETITTVEIDDETYEEIIKVSFK